MTAVRGVSEAVRAAGLRKTCHRCGHRIIARDGTRSASALLAQVGTGLRVGPTGPYKATLGIVRVICEECSDGFAAWWGTP